MATLKFENEGWRAITAKDCIVENIRKLAVATAKWMNTQGFEKVFIGHDSRFGGSLFAEETAKVMGAHGIKINLSKGFVATPMVALAVAKTKSDIGIMISAGELGPEYNGFNVKMNTGAPMPRKGLSAIEAFIPKSDENPTSIGLKEMFANGQLNYIDPEDIYVDQIRMTLDIPAIQSAGMSIAYDAMYGAGQHAFMRLMPTGSFLHCDDNPTFKGKLPVADAANLKELALLTKHDAQTDCGMATNGDVTYIGMYDEDGVFVDTQKVMLLNLWYLCKFKKMTGKVIAINHSSTKLEAMTKVLELPFQKIEGHFNMVSSLMENKEVLMVIDPSFGIACKAHLPERDALWQGLLVLEFMAKTGKTLNVLVKEMELMVGENAYVK